MQQIWRSVSKFCRKIFEEIPNKQSRKVLDHFETRLFIDHEIQGTIKHIL